MNLQALPAQVERFMRENSTAILAGIGATGVVTTGYLAHQAGWKAATSTIYFEIEGGRQDSRKERIKERARRNWKLYIPPTIVGGVAIGCIIAGTRVGNRRTAAMAAAYSLSEKAFVEYKEKVVEKLGERKDQSVRDEIAQERIAANPIGREVILVGSGTVLCCELHTGRYFLGDMDTLKKAQNEINDRINRHEYATLQEFQVLINISPTDSSMDFGWDQERGLMSLDITTTLMDEIRPCLAFSYSYLKAL